MENPPERADARQDSDLAPADGELGPGAAFPTTRWSRLVPGPGADAAADRAALEALARRYWRPIAAYVRSRWARSDEEARDSTQEFFLWMLEGDFLSRADPARGSFRGLVKTSLANFLHDRERRRRTLKRGGGHRRVSLGPLGDAAAPLTELADPGRGPEEVLDDLWRRELLGQAADALESELRGRGKGAAFEVFRDYFLGDEELDHATLATRHGITTVDVSNHLSFAKTRYRAHLRAAVIDTVGSDEALRAELAWLFEERGR